MKSLFQPILVAMPLPSPNAIAFQEALLVKAPDVSTLRIAAANDAQAVTQWLNEYRASPQTWRTYRKEAERLLLWLGEQGLTLKQVRREHLMRFETFLGDPQPAARWIGPPRPREHPQWRPFRRPLSPASRRQSLIILQGMYAWLVEAGWVEHNPFRLMRDKRRRLDNRQPGIERYLERPLWEWLWAWINRPLNAEATEKARYQWHRRRLIFGFAYLLAPRISEMAAARMGDFLQREGRWWWQTVGKGDRLARIPVPPSMLELLIDWRHFLNLSEFPSIEEQSALLRRQNGLDGLGVNQLYRLIKETFRQAADALENEQGEEGVALAVTLRRASPHWLRHTAITHQAQNGVELRYLTRNARHSRLDTTARYLHAEAEEWHQQSSSHELAVFCTTSHSKGPT